MKEKWLYIESIEKLKSVLGLYKTTKVIAVDTETTGLDPYLDQLRLIQLAANGQPTCLIDCFKVMPEAKGILSNLFTTDAVKVFQNGKFDIKFLKAAGIDVSGRLFDTMLAARLLRTSGGPRRANLHELAKHYLGVELSKEEQTSDFSGELSLSQLQYAAKDAEILLELRQEMIPELKANRLIEVARLEFACLYTVVEMELSGIHLSMDKWKELTDIVEVEKAEILEQIYPYIGYPTVQLGLFESIESTEVNLNSNKQVLDLLKAYGLDLPDTSRQTLVKYLDHPIVSLLLKYRHTNKALTSFLYNMPKLVNPVTGRLHPQYGQIGAYSGRMSCGNPNIQQIPREDRFRECFLAPQGRMLVIADYSQIELRVIAQVSQDKRMIAAYVEGKDLHQLTASLVLDKAIEEVTKSERQAAKAVNFGLIFGMGAAGLKAYAAESYNAEMSLEEAELFRNRYFQAYSGVERWQSRIRKALPKEERTLAGRKFLFGELSSLSGRYNSPIQGTAADILKNALGNLPSALKGTNTKVVAVVHDEIILDCPFEKKHDVAEILTRTMEEAGSRYLKDVPVVAEAFISKSWAGK